MKKSIYFVILVFGINLIICAAQKDKALQPVKSWIGDRADERQSEPASNKELPDSPIFNQSDWIKLWQALRDDETPKIDFTKNFIIFCTTFAPNHCSIDLKLSRTGDLKIHSTTTIMNTDGSTLSYKILLIRRAGIKSIKGKPIARSNTR
jgi:hypothetical protein